MNQSELRYRNYHAVYDEPTGSYMVGRVGKVGFFATVSNEQEFHKYVNARLTRVVNRSAKWEGRRAALETTYFESDNLGLRLDVFKWADGDIELELIDGDGRTPEFYRFISQHPKLDELAKMKENAINQAYQRLEERFDARSGNRLSEKVSDANR